MDPQAKKNLQAFKKQIKRSAIQKKRKQVRRGLPYYQDMFRDVDESSNGTNSRSSRFPVRTCSSKEKVNIFDERRVYSAEFKQTNYSKEQDEMKKNRYLEYLRNLNSTFSKQDKCMVEKNMKLAFGEACFEDMNLLRDKAYCELMDYDNTISDDQDLNELDYEDWDFIIASFKIAENQQFSQISKLSLGLIGGYYNEWNQNEVHKQILKKKQTHILHQNMQRIEQHSIMVDEIIISKLIQNSQVQLNNASIYWIVNYFKAKISCYQHLQQEILQVYGMDELYTFSQIILNFGFIYAMQTLAEIASRQGTDSYTRMDIFFLVSKYFSQFPISLVSGTQTQQKFQKFISYYLQQLINFMQGFNKTIYALPIQRTYQCFIKTALNLVQFLLWRGMDGQLLKLIIKIYDLSIEACLNTDGTMNNLIQFENIHMRILDLSVLMFSWLEGVQEWFLTSNYFVYLNLLTLFWHEFKLKSRNNLSEHYFKSTKLFNLEFYLVYSIYITDFLSDQIQDVVKQNQVRKLLQYAQFVYQKERDILHKFNCQSLQNINLVFQPNVKLYFQLFAPNVKIKEPNSNNNPNFEKQEEIQI